MKKRILYIQYFNPAMYPPLEHSSRIFADNGWEVLFFGTGSYGQSDAMDFEAHPNIRVKRLRHFDSGFFLKLHYLYFAFSSLITVLVWKPSHIYISDMLSCAAALPASCLRVQTIYHEHDSMAVSGTFTRLLRWARTRLCRKAVLIILPSPGRVVDFHRDTGNRFEGKTLCVMNCPVVQEVSAVRALADTPLRLYYHGSINPSRFPVSIIRALSMLAPQVRLVITAYETVGSKGYLDSLKQSCREMNVAECVEFTPIKWRKELLDQCSGCHAGISFMPKTSGDPNHLSMAGASNKAFEYMACGLALLVTDRPDWRRMYADPGYGVACDPESAESIRAALEWFLAHPELRRRMGDAGRQKILSEWNYEMQFLPVLKRLGELGE